MKTKKSRVDHMYDTDQFDFNRDSNFSSACRFRMARPSRGLHSPHWGIRPAQRSETFPRAQEPHLGQFNIQKTLPCYETRCTVQYLHITPDTSATAEAILQEGVPLPWCSVAFLFPPFSNFKKISRHLVLSHRRQSRLNLVHSPRGMLPYHFRRMRPRRIRHDRQFPSTTNVPQGYRYIAAQ